MISEYPLSPKKIMTCVKKPRIPNTWTIKGKMVRFTWKKRHKTEIASSFLLAMTVISAVIARSAAICS